MLDPHFAEEDCEESIVRTLLGIGDDRDRRIAWKIAEHFERYAPTLPFLRDEFSPNVQDILEKFESRN